MEVVEPRTTTVDGRTLPVTREQSSVHLSQQQATLRSDLAIVTDELEPSSKSKPCCHVCGSGRVSGVRLVVP